MPLRGSRAAFESGRGVGRGAGRGRGRGRGRGKTTISEWESYTPGPDVYQQLWRIRKEPVTVTLRLPDQCPLPYVQTRILDRRQTDDGRRQNFYVVEIVEQSPDKSQPNTTTAHVDVSCILDYVSPFELERFENEQFSIEAEAEAVAARVEAEEVARRRLARNAREPVTGLSRGRGRGSRILSGLGLGMEALHAAPKRGRPRGSRGRGRGRYRGSWRGRGQLALSSRLRHGSIGEDIVNAESTGAFHHEEDDVTRVIDETDSEEESLPDEPVRSSPSRVGPAFITNSALPMSPVPRRMASSLNVRREVSASPHISESDVDLGKSDTRSMSSAAVQLRQEYQFGERTIPESQTESTTSDRHRSKRRRTVSESSTSELPTSKAPTGSVFEPEGPYTQQLLFRESSLPEVNSGSEPLHPQPQDLMFRNQSSIPEFDSESINGDISAQQLPPTNPHSNNHNDDAISLDNDTIRVLPSPSNPDPNHHHSGDNSEGAAEDDAEEYVVESIIEHFYDGRKKYYLVKWEGFEDSHDWLPEEDLAGAADIVSEYNRRIARIKNK
ncbi:hypothetical protein J1614_011668 [Plenodomus biglobosus]|nr:hypothetical protein J1614_011668 [Plenodomus biglobosus]